MHRWDAAGVTHLFDLAELLLHLMVDSLRLDQLLLQIRTDTLEYLLKRLFFGYD